jgi:hypothetical protein
MHEGGTKVLSCCSLAACAALSASEAGSCPECGALPGAVAASVMAFALSSLSDSPPVSCAGGHSVLSASLGPSSLGELLRGRGELILCERARLRAFRSAQAANACKRPANQTQAFCDGKRTRAHCPSASHLHTLSLHALDNAICGPQSALWTEHVVRSCVDRAVLCCH